MTDQLPEPARQRLVRLRDAWQLADERAAAAQATFREAVNMAVEALGYDVTVPHPPTIELGSGRITLGQPPTEPTASETPGSGP